MSRRAAIALLAISACTQPSGTKEDPAGTTTPPPAPTAAAPAPAPAPAPSALGEEAYVTSVSGLRRAATEDRQIEDPSGKKGKKVSNWVTTLHRGEMVRVLEVQGEWARVRASDESEGWLKKDGLLPTEGVTMATVLAPAKTFDRPDLLALNAKRTLEPGQLLYVTKSKDQFSEVNHAGSALTWVLTEALTSDRREVDASKLVNKARWLEERKDANADAIWELARSQFGDTKVMQLLAPPEPPAEEPPAAPAPQDGAVAGGNESP